MTKREIKRERKSYILNALYEMDKDNPAIEKLKYHNSFSDVLRFNSCKYLSDRALVIYKESIQLLKDGWRAYNMTNLCNMRGHDVWALCHPTIPGFMIDSCSGKGWSYYPDEYTKDTLPDYGNNYKDFDYEYEN
jgi:hypothetical protein